VAKNTIFVEFANGIMKELTLAINEPLDFCLWPAIIHLIHFSLFVMHWMMIRKVCKIWIINLSAIFHLP